MSSTTQLVVGLGLLAGVGSAAWAQGGGALAISEVLGSARSRSPTMELARLDEQISRTQASQALALQLPHISLSDRQTYRYNNPEAYTFDYDACDSSVDEYCPPPVASVDGQIIAPEDTLSNSLSLSGFQPIIAPRQVVAILQADARADLRSLQVKGKEEALVLDALNSYYSLQALRGQREVYERSLALTLELEKATLGKLKTGQTTQLDYDRVALDKLQLEQKIASVDAQLALSATELAWKAGLEDGAALRVCSLAPATDTRKDLSLGSSTTLLIKEQQVTMDRLGLAASRSAVLPTLNLVGGVTWSGSGQTLEEQFFVFQYDHWFVGASLSLSLFDGMARYHDTRGATLEYDRSSRQASLERQELSLKDKKALARLDDIDEQLSLMTRSVSLAEAQVEAMQARFLAGTATFEMYTQSRQYLEGLRMQQVLLLAEQWQVHTSRHLNAGQMETIISLVGFADDLRASEGACGPVSAG